MNFRMDFPMVACNLACVYYMHDKKNQGDKIFSTLKEKAREEYIPATYLAQVHNVLGEMDEAYKWWRKACDDRDFMLPFFLSLPLDFMRTPNEKRFHDLIEKMWAHK